MPDHGGGRVHRFSDHVVAGVNWRPTRFVDEVPSSRVCGLCRMIPKRTVLLPCSHALCQSCHVASLEGGVGQCPLDQVQFEEAECFGYEFPARIASTLKVYCWNEQHGCEYAGTMDRMLEHYENECAFHTVDCWRCGEGVQHRDLRTHYVNECRAGVSAAITECPSWQQLLPVIQSQLNELTEQVRSQEARFAGITRDIGASECNLKGDMAQIAATISSTMSHQLTSQRNQEEEASTSSSLSLRLEKALILRKLERLADLESSRQTFPEPDFGRVIAHFSHRYGGARHLASALSTTPEWIENIGSVNYELTLENCEEIIQYQKTWLKKFAQFRVWHMRDTHFTVAVSKRWKNPAHVLTVEIEFNGMLVESRCWPPFWQVRVWDDGKHSEHTLTPRRGTCICHRYDNSLHHFHLEFHIEIDPIDIDDFLPEGKMRFSLFLSNSEMINSVKGAP
nr:uncharacterized protein LOC129383825 isoform X2 [Dermacentor andersoni]